MQTSQSLALKEVLALHVELACELEFSMHLGLESF
jgi:hypothetical protein